MSNWKYRINVTGIFHNDDLTISQKGIKIASIIRQKFPSIWLDWLSEDYDEELDNIVEALENITGYDDTSPTQEFDGWWNEFYNWADQEVAPFSKWPRNKMCWVKTV